MPNQPFALGEPGSVIAAPSAETPSGCRDTLLPSPTVQLENRCSSPCSTSHFDGCNRPAVQKGPLDPWWCHRPPTSHRVWQGGGASPCSLCHRLWQPHHRCCSWGGCHHIPHHRLPEEEAATRCPASEQRAYDGIHQVYHVSSCCCWSAAPGQDPGHPGSSAQPYQPIRTRAQQAGQAHEPVRANQREGRHREHARQPRASCGTRGAAP